MLYLHEVDGVAGKGDEDDFHDEEVEGFPAEEHIDVAGDEDCEVKLLSSVR